MVIDIYFFALTLIKISFHAINEYICTKECKNDAFIDNENTSGNITMRKNYL